MGMDMGELAGSLWFIVIKMYCLRLLVKITQEDLQQILCHIKKAMTATTHLSKDRSRNTRREKIFVYINEASQIDGLNHGRGGRNRNSYFSRSAGLK